jgi:uncharacterized membrane protein
MVVDKIFFTGLIFLLVGLVAGLIAFIISRDPAPDDLPFVGLVISTPLSIAFIIRGIMLMIFAI